MNEESTGSSESMKAATVPHQTRNEGSRDESIKDNSGPVANANAKIEERVGLLISVVAIIAAAVAWSRVDGGRDLSEARYKDLEGRYLSLNEQYSRTEREARMLEYYVLELDGKLMSGGLIPAQRGYEHFKRERTAKGK